MRRYQRTPVTREESVETHRECDICKQTIQPDRFKHITIQNVDRYPEGSYGSAFDVCDPCWDAHIVPLMKNPPFTDFD